MKKLLIISTKVCAYITEYPFRCLIANLLPEGVEPMYTLLVAPSPISSVDTDIFPSILKGLFHENSHTLDKGTSTLHFFIEGGSIPDG